MFFVNKHPRNISFAVMVVVAFGCGSDGPRPNYDELDTGPKFEGSTGIKIAVNAAREQKSLSGQPKPVAFHIKPSQGIFFEGDVSQAPPEMARVIWVRIAEANGSSELRVVNQFTTTTFDRRSSKETYLVRMLAPKVPGRYVAVVSMGNDEIGRVDLEIH